MATIEDKRYINRALIENGGYVRLPTSGMPVTPKLEKGVTVVRENGTVLRIGSIRQGIASVRAITREERPLSELPLHKRVGDYTIRMGPGGTQTGIRLVQIKKTRKGKRGILEYTHDEEIEVADLMKDIEAGRARIATGTDLGMTEDGGEEGAERRDDRRRDRPVRRDRAAFLAASEIVQVPRTLVASHLISLRDHGDSGHLERLIATMMEDNDTYLTEYHPPVIAMSLLPSTLNFDIGKLAYRIKEALDNAEFPEDQKKVLAETYAHVLSSLRALAMLHPDPEQLDRIGNFTFSDNDKLVDLSNFTLPDWAKGVEFTVAEMRVLLYLARRDHLVLKIPSGRIQEELTQESVSRIFNSIAHHITRVSLRDVLRHLRRIINSHLRPANTDSDLRQMDAFECTPEMALAMDGHIARRRQQSYKAIHSLFTKLAVCAPNVNISNETEAEEYIDEIERDLSGIRITRQEGRAVSVDLQLDFSEGDRNIIKIGRLGFELKHGEKTVNIVYFNNAGEVDSTGEIDDHGISANLYDVLSNMALNFPTDLKIGLRDSEISYHSIFEQDHSLAPEMVYALGQDREDDAIFLCERIDGVRSEPRWGISASDSPEEFQKHKDALMNVVKFTIAAARMLRANLSGQDLSAAEAYPGKAEEVFLANLKSPGQFFETGTDIGMAAKGGEEEVNPRDIVRMRENIRKALGALTTFLNPDEMKLEHIWRWRFDAGRVAEELKESIGEIGRSIEEATKIDPAFAAKHPDIIESYADIRVRYRVGMAKMKQVDAMDGERELAEIGRYIDSGKLQPLARIEWDEERRLILAMELAVRGFRAEAASVLTDEDSGVVEAWSEEHFGGFAQMLDFHSARLHNNRDLAQASAEFLQEVIADMIGPETKQRYFGPLSALARLLDRHSNGTLNQLRFEDGLDLAMATDGGEEGSVSETLPRIVAHGDIHGELDGFIENLRQAGIIDEYDNWRGGEEEETDEEGNVLVQGGDVIDRGPKSREAMEFLRKLQKQAREAKRRKGKGARDEVVRIAGNHELMLLQGDFRYANFSDPQGLAAEIRGEISNGDIKAAHVIGDRLVVHGGLRSAIREMLKAEIVREKGIPIDKITEQDIADRINEVFVEAVRNNDYTHPIFWVDAARGGHDEVAGIFWCDFEDLMVSVNANEVKQWVAHTPEIRLGSIDPFTDSLGRLDMDAGLHKGYGGVHAFYVVEDNQLKRVEKGADGEWGERVLGKFREDDAVAADAQAEVDLDVLAQELVDQFGQKATQVSNRVFRPQELEAFLAERGIASADDPRVEQIAAKAGDILRQRADVAKPITVATVGAAVNTDERIIAHDMQLLVDRGLLRRAQDLTMLSGVQEYALSVQIVQDRYGNIVVDKTSPDTAFGEQKTTLKYALDGKMAIDGDAHPNLREAVKRHNDKTDRANREAVAYNLSLFDSESLWRTAKLLTMMAGVQEAVQGIYVELDASGRIEGVGPTPRQNQQMSIYLTRNLNGEISAEGSMHPNLAAALKQYNEDTSDITVDIGMAMDGGEEDKAAAITSPAVAREHMQNINRDHLARKEALMADIEEGHQVIIPEELMPEGAEREKLIAEIRARGARDIAILPMDEVISKARNRTKGPNRVVLLSPDLVEYWKTKDGNWDKNCKAQTITLENYDLLHLEGAVALGRAVLAEDRQSVQHFYNLLTGGQLVDMDAIMRAVANRELRLSVILPAIEIPEAEEYHQLQREAFQFLTSA